MLALLSDRKSGEVSTYDIPAPELRPGGILVRTEYSAISAGTERATLDLSSKSLFAKAKARPDLVKQVFEYARQNGLRAAYDKVRSKLDTLTTLGYSSAGEVIAVADDVHEFRPGDRVACGGGTYANHAEVNFVPRNLAVHIPSQVSTLAASLTTIGAIALQGFRQAEVRIGETVAVIGAGLVGARARVYDTLRPPDAAWWQLISHLSVWGAPEGSARILLWWPPTQRWSQASRISPDMAPMRLF